MLAKPPLWEAWPPLEAMALTSSLGLHIFVSILFDMNLCWVNCIPVGKVTRVSIAWAVRVAVTRRFGVARATSVVVARAGVFGVLMGTAGTATLGCYLADLLLGKVGKVVGVVGCHFDMYVDKV
jgi:hypothetical protein